MCLDDVRTPGSQEAIGASDEARIERPRFLDLGPPHRVLVEMIQERGALMPPPVEEHDMEIDPMRGKS